MFYSAETFLSAFPETYLGNSGSSFLVISGSCSWEIPQNFWFQFFTGPPSCCQQWVVDRTYIHVFRSNLEPSERMDTSSTTDRDVSTDEEPRRYIEHVSSIHKG